MAIEVMVWIALAPSSLFAVPGAVCFCCGLLCGLGVGMMSGVLLVVVGSMMFRVMGSFVLAVLMLFIGGRVVLGVVSSCCCAALGVPFVSSLIFHLLAAAFSFGAQAREIRSLGEDEERRVGANPIGMCLPLG